MKFPPSMAKLLRFILAAWARNLALIIISISVGAILHTQAAESASSQAKSLPPRIRIAITGFAGSMDSQEIKTESQNLTDLLTVQVSHSSKFELIDREYVQKIIHESVLSLANFTEPSQAIQVGKLLGADWLVLGSFMGSGEGSTNRLIVKIVDAHTGIIRDLTAVVFASKELPTEVPLIADFLSWSADRASVAEQRIFIGLGGFEDLSINDRYPHFRRELWTSLEINFQRTRFTVVERSMVEPLLNELRLNLGGLIDKPSVEPSAQPVFLLVDGVYQSYQDNEAKISLILRVEEIGGSQNLYSFKEAPGDELNTHVANILGKALTDLSQKVRKASRKEEAATQVARGIERSRVNKSGPNHYFLGGYAPRQDDSKRLKNISEAIEAFQTAILLDPDNDEAKLDLAICLVDSAIGQTETGRDYLTEVIAGCPNVSLVHTARRELARSYLSENQGQALHLLLGLDKETVDPVERAELFQEMLEPCYDLQRKGNLSTPESTKVWQGLLLAQCAIIESTNCHNKILLSPQGLCHPLIESFDLYFLNGHTNRQIAVEHFNEFLAEQVKANPGLAPYLWSACAFWPTANSPVLPEVLMQSLPKAWEACRDRPQDVLRSAYLNSNYLPELLEWSLSHSQYQLGGVLAQIMRRLSLEQSQESKAIKFLWASRGRGPGKIFYYAGYCDRGLGNWKDARDDFQTGKDLADSVTMDFGGPWGNAGTRVSGQDLILECQSHFASGDRGNPEAAKSEIRKEPARLELGSPVLTLGESTVFACDGGKIWLTDGFAPFVYDKATDELRDLDWPTNIERNVTSICVGRDTVWWGTDGSGLVELDKATRHCKVYSEKENLILPYITDLALSGDRLWIGFGRKNAGGIGYLDLRTRKFVGLTPNLDTASLTNRVYPAIPERFEMPPRSKVGALYLASSSELWFVSGFGIGTYSKALNRWSKLSLVGVGVSPWDCVVANSNIAAMGGCGRASGIIIHDFASGKDTEIEMRPALANLPSYQASTAQSARSMAFEGKQLWVGGIGFLARIDPASKQVEALCGFDQRLGFWVQRLEVQEDGIWAAIGNKLYRLPRYVGLSVTGKTSSNPPNRVW
jgi:TolB-like protein/tetratricopeptide (TPR) repeat protein